MREVPRASPGVLRRATLDDAPALHELFTASVRGLSAGYLTPEQIEAELAFVIGLDTQIIRDNSYFVLVNDDGRIMGAGGWSARRAVHGSDAFKAAQDDDADAPVDPAHEAARIRQMFTHPDFARRGVARRIFEAARADAESRGFTRFVLTATMPGVPLYRALGFTVTREFVDRLPNGVEVPVAEMVLGE